MANVFTTQILEQGSRNIVIKLTGVLDTSNLAATGTIGTAGVTTTGSNTISFTAGSLVPTVGQFITSASGTGTGIPTGAYITSIISATSVTINLPVVTGGTGWTFTGTAGAVVAIDPTTFVDNDIFTPNSSISQVRIDHIDYSIQDQLEVQLQWDATAPVIIMPIAGRGRMSFWNFGGLTNNAGTGKTGLILITTTGWSSGTQVFSVILECVKQYT